MSFQYKDDIRSVYNMISKQDQVALYEQMRNGDVGARNELIHSCLPLVYDIAKKFHVNNRHIDLDDLIQHGNIALIRAVDNWDVNKASITTVATYYVRNALIDMIKDSKYNIKTKYDMTRQAAEDINKIKAVGSDDVEEIMKATGLIEKRVKLLLRIMNGKRIDYSLLNLRLHSSEDYEITGEVNVKGCVADIIGLLDQHIEDERDREIFIAWISFLNRNNKTRLVAQEVDATTDEVSESVRKTKKTLRLAVKDMELIHA